MRSLILIASFVCASAFAADATQNAQNNTKSPSKQAVAAAPGLQVVNVPQLQDIKGVVSWDLLAKVDHKAIKDRILPIFSKDVIALNDQEVKIQGFMMPLEPGQKQKHFLISVASGTCPYCMPAGPEGVVEILTAAPIKYGFEPIIVSGKLAVLKDDPTGLYYKMTNAVLSSAN
jgi:hypothetical protein